MIGLQVAGEFLDLFPDAQFALSYQVKPVAEPDKVAGSRSVGFEIPLSGRNRSLLGFPSELQLDNLTGRQRISATVFSGASPISSGFLQLEGVKSGVVSATYYGETSSFIERAKNLRLKDIDLSELTHDWEAAEVVAAISNTWEDGYTYPLIDYGREAAQNTTTIDESRFYPALFLKYVIRAGVQTLGYTVGGEFFENDPLFSKMIIPRSGQPVLSDTDISTNRLSASSNSGQTLTGSYAVLNLQNVTEAGDSWNSGTYEWTAPFNCIVNVWGYMRFTGGSAGIRRVGYRKNATDVQLGAFGLASPFIAQGWATVTMDAGDTLELVGLSPGGGTVSQAQMVIEVRPALVPGGPADLSGSLPDWSLMDLIKEVAQMCAVVVDFNDAAGVLTLDRFEAIASNASETWSGKTDGEPEMEYSPTLGKLTARSRFTYADDSNDVELKTYKDDTGRTFGDGVMLLQNELLPQEQKDVVKLKFASSVQVFAFSGLSANQRIPLARIQVFDLDTLEPQQGAVPRILIHDTVDLVDISNVEELTIVNIPGANTPAYSQVVSTISWAYFYLPDTLSSDYPDGLAFGRPASLVRTNQLTLIENYYFTYSRVVEKSVKIKSKVKLNQNDLMAPAWLTPKFIKTETVQGTFLLDKISNWQEELPSTECEFYLLP